MSGLSIRKLAQIAVVALAPVAMGHAQKEMVGEWQGTANVQGQAMHLLWHVSAAPDGAITSTFDNVDEGVSGIKVKSMELKGSSLVLTIDDSVDAGGQEVRIAGVFTGTVNTDFSEVSGSWEQSEPQEASGDISLRREIQEKPASAPGAAMQSAAAQTAKIAGDWEGTLHAGPAELRLVLHVKPAADGKLSATLDSVDQGAMGIPVSAVTLDGAKIKLTVDAVHGTYDGTVNADSSAIQGTWSQGEPLDLSFTRASGAAKAEPRPAPPTDVDGTWQGNLEVGGTTLRVLFKFANTTDGLTGQLQSPDQAPTWLPMSSVTHTADAITIEIKGIGGTFEGKVSADKQTIDGTFTQMGNAMPLTVNRPAEPSAAAKGQ